MDGRGGELETGVEEELTWPWTVAAMVGEELTWHSSKYLSNVTHRQPWRMRGLGGCRRGGCHAAGIADHSGHQVVEDLAYKNENFIFVNFLSQPSKK